MEQQLGEALLVPVRPLASATPVEHLGVEQGRVAAGFEVSQLAVTKPLGLKVFSSSSLSVPGPRCYWAGGIDELDLVGGAQTGGAHWQVVEGQPPQTSGLAVAALASILHCPAFSLSCCATEPMLCDSHPPAAGWSAA